VQFLQVRNEMFEIGALGFLNQLAGHLGVVADDVFDHFLDPVRPVAVVMGHAQGIPGVAVHWLQQRGLFERRGGGFMVAQLGVGKTQPIPGLIELGIDLDGTAKRSDRGFAAASLFAYIAQVEPGAGLFRGTRQGVFQHRLGRAIVVGLGQQKARHPGRVEHLGVGGQGLTKGGNGRLPTTDQVEQVAAQVVAPGVVIHQATRLGQGGGILRRTGGASKRRLGTRSG
jgi:hypothetical protein